jgi:hypothetical protein
MATRGVKLYGTAPGARLIDYQVNEVGVHTAIVSTPYVERRDAMTPAPVVKPSLAGLAISTLRLADNGKGGFELQWLFKGQPEGDAFGMTVTYGTPDDPIVEFDPEDAQLTLLALPHWREIADKYGGYEQGGQPFFPEYMPDGGTSSSSVGLGGGSNNNAGKANSLYGQKTWDSAYGTLYIRYTSHSVPARAWKDVNRVITAPPGLDKIKFTTPTGRNWLKRAPSIRARGTVLEFAERYSLSGPGGHNPDVYKFGQFQ